MRESFRTAYEQDCDCPCPTHRGQPRSIYNDPDCHCLATCATQPMTLLAPDFGGALFLNYHGALWLVPALESGRWDWRNAEPVDIGHPLFNISDAIGDLLRRSIGELRQFRHH